MTTPVTIVVEGLTDVPVVDRILQTVGCSIAYTYGLSGKRALMRDLGGYNRAAQFSPWMIVRDLDHDAACAAELIAVTLPDPSKWMRFRIAVRAVEAWMLADAERLAEFLHVHENTIPADPETLPDPKLTLVNVARSSSRAEIREDMVPTPGTSGKVGPAYTSRVMEFARNQWRPVIASNHSDSLRRCLERARELANYIKNGVVQA